LAAGVSVGGGPVVGIVVATTVVWVTAGVVSTVVAGGVVVTGAWVVTAGGRVRMTMVGVWGAGALSLRRYGVIPMRAAMMVPTVAMSWIQGNESFFSSAI
jgi:hypothetical protein